MSASRKTVVTFYTFAAPAIFGIAFVPFHNLWAAAIYTAATVVYFTCKNWGSVKGTVKHLHRKWGS